MVAHLKQLSASRTLFFTWIVRDIKVRYKQSLLGASWAVVQPLASALILALIFSRIVPVDLGGRTPTLIFYYAGMLPWTFFSNSLSLGTNSLISNMHLVTKIYFPREIIPLSSVVASLLDLAIASSILVVLIVIEGAVISPAVALLPIALIIQVAISTAFVLAGSAFGVFYRDVRFIVPLATQLLLYLTPVIYPVSIVPERLRDLYMLNPMAVVIEIWRASVGATTVPQPYTIAISVGVSLLSVSLAYLYFKRVEPQMADLI